MPSGQKGSPIRALVNRKNVVRSGFYSGHLCGASPFAVPIQSCVFVPFDSASTPQAIAWRGDPFSHPSGSSALEPILLDPIFGPKGAGRDRSWSRLPPARFSGSSFFYSRGPVFGKPRSHGLCAQGRLSRPPENLQCRAVFIQFKRVLVPREPCGFRGPTRS